MTTEMTITRAAGLSRVTFLTFLALFFLAPSCLKPIPVFATAETKTYDELLNTIRENHQPGNSLTKQGLVRQAWNLGKILEEDSAAHSLWSDYTGYVNPKLAADSGIAREELYDMRRFAKVYPGAVPPWNLNWEHYKLILQIQDPTERKAVFEKAEKQHWSLRKLRMEMKKVLWKNPVSPNSFPKKLNLYRIVKMPSGLALDLGFGNELRLEKSSLFKEREIVRCEGPDAGSCKPAGDAGAEDLYAYSAEVAQIVDGDTLDAVMDLGFGFTTRQKFRLRGIDAPEMNTPEGLAAKQFVYDEMIKYGARVILRAGKLDKYNRYLADVFIPLEPDPVYLNQLLIDKGHAVRAEE